MLYQSPGCTQRDICPGCSGPGMQGLCFRPAFQGETEGSTGSILPQKWQRQWGSCQNTERAWKHVTSMRSGEVCNPAREQEPCFLLLLTQGVGRKAIHTSSSRFCVTSLTFPCSHFLCPQKVTQGSDFKYLAQCKQTQRVD